MLLPVRIEHKCGVVVWTTRSGCPIVGPAGLKGGGMECIDLSPTLGCKRGMLVDRMRVVAIDPEDWIIETVADTIATDIVGHLAAHAKCRQGCVVEYGGTA